jgi:tetratricopeptide (TPR) repeat protein
LAQAHGAHANALSGIYSVDDPRVVMNLRYSEELWRDLLKERPDDLNFLAGLAQSTSELARHLFYTKQREEAELVAASAAELGRQLIERAGNDPGNRLLAARIYRNSADPKRMAGKHEEAIKDLEQARDNLSKALELNPRNPAARDLLRTVRGQQAEEMNLLGQRDKAIEILRALVESERAW